MSQKSQKPHFSPILALLFTTAFSGAMGRSEVRDELSFEYVSYINCNEVTGPSIDVKTAIKFHQMGVFDNLLVPKRDDGYNSDLEFEVDGYTTDDELLAEMEMKEMERVFDSIDGVGDTYTDSPLTTYALRYGLDDLSELVVPEVDETLTNQNSYYSELINNYNKDPISLCHARCVTSKYCKGYIGFDINKYNRCLLDLGTECLLHTSDIIFSGPYNEPSLLKVSEIRYPSEANGGPRVERDVRNDPLRGLVQTVIYTTPTEASQSSSEPPLSPQNVPKMVQIASLTSLNPFTSIQTPPKTLSFRFAHPQFSPDSIEKCVSKGQFRVGIPSNLDTQINFDWDQREVKWLNLDIFGVFDRLQNPLLLILAHLEGLEEEEWNFREPIIATTIPNCFATYLPKTTTGEELDGGEETSLGVPTIDPEFGFMVGVATQEVIQGMRLNPKSRWAISVRGEWYLGTTPRHLYGA